MHSRTRLLLGVLAILMATSSWLPAQEGPSKAKSQLKELEEGMDAAYAKWRKEQKEKMAKLRAEQEKAKKDGQEVPPMPPMRMAPKEDFYLPHIEKARKLAKSYGTSDDAIGFQKFLLMMGLRSRNKDVFNNAAKAITTTHIASDKLGESANLFMYATRLVGKDVANGYLRALETNSPHSQVRATAILARVTESLENAGTDTMAYKAAKEEALRAAAMTDDTDIKTRVKGLIDGRENLVTGKVAPDIIGVDLDGTSFKLSDYKGKIVLLDFWGDW